MADVKMPESVPCRFDAKGWAPCKKPSDNGWCTKHENLRCVSCGKQATGSCDAQMGGLACGAALCDDCRHSYGEGAAHVTKEVAEEQQKKKVDEREARVASRNSPIQRMDKKLGVPLTLFELLKGDWQKEYDILHVYSLELKHGLMGYFPTVFSADRQRIVMTVDLGLLLRVGETLAPREAKLRGELSYVNKERSIAYLEPETPSLREEQVPSRLLTAEEFGRLMGSEKTPFRWAPGLIGARVMDKERFQQVLAQRAAEFEPSSARAV